MRYILIILTFATCVFTKNISFSFGWDENAAIISLKNDFSLQKGSNLYFSSGVGIGVNMFFAGLKYDSNHKSYGNSFLINLGFAEQEDKSINKYLQISFFRKLIINESKKSFLNIGLSTISKFDDLNDISHRRPIFPILSYNLYFN